MSETPETSTPTDGAETAGSLEAPVADAPDVSQETDWVAEARKWEKRAKENASRLKEAEPKLSEYDRLVEASKTDLERAQATAQKANESLAGYRERLASAELRVALTGVVPDPAAVIEDLNVAKFIGEDGEVNADAVAALRGKYAALAPEAKRAPAPNPAQGSSANGASTASQLTQEDVSRLYRERKYDDIEQARKDGRLTNLYGASS